MKREIPEKRNSRAAGKTGQSKPGLPKAGTLLLLLLAAAGNGWCQEDLTAREQQVQRIITWAGAASVCAGSAAMWAQQIWFEPDAQLFTQDAEQWQKLAVTVPSVIAYTGVAAWSLHTFAGLYMQWEISKAWSVPIGMLGGAAAGALTGAAGFMTLFAIAQPMGIVDTGSIQGYIPVIGMSIISGGLWGGLAGVLPGMVIGPGLSFSFDY